METSETREVCISVRNLIHNPFKHTFQIETLKAQYLRRFEFKKPRKLAWKFGESVQFAKISYGERQKCHALLVVEGNALFTASQGLGPLDDGPLVLTKQ